MKRMQVWCANPENQVFLNLVRARPGKLSFPSIKVFSTEL